MKLEFLLSPARVEYTNNTLKCKIGGLDAPTSEHAMINYKKEKIILLILKKNQPKQYSLFYRLLTRLIKKRFFAKKKPKTSSSSLEALK